MAEQVAVPTSEIKRPKFSSRKYISNSAIHGDSNALRDSFSVVSYNILAECHRVRWDYSYTGEEFLCQEYRHGVLMEELRYLDGDVVCLQEVNPQYYNTSLLPAMKRLGYDGLMKCRTKDYYDEGEATFFKTSVFELVSNRDASLSKTVHEMIEKTDVDPAVKTAAIRYLDQADVVLITCLRCKTTGRVVTIGNVHLWWDDERHPDVKTVQAACAVQEVMKVCGRDGAHVICGDFNSDASSPVYQLLTDGHMSDSSVKALQSVEGLDLDNGLSSSLIDHFKAAVYHSSTDLKSSYSTVLGAEPALTCYTEKEWQLDFTFYCAKTLLVLGVLDMVNMDTVVSTGGLPSQDFPSDHLSLKTYFSFA